MDSLELDQSAGIKSPVCFYRLLTWGVLALFWVPLPSLGVEAEVGVAAVEEGDDRLRPAAMAHVGITDALYVRGYIWGREFSGVTERTVLVAAGHRFPIFGSKYFSAGIGGALMDEYTELGATAAATDAGKTEHNYNVGASTTLAAEYETGGAYLRASWDAHLFLAGVAGIFLATGRKQALTISAGYRL